MAKKFPRFLFSDPTNVKSKGPFIIHSLEPQFICTPEFDNKRNIIDCRVLEIFNKDHSMVDVLPVLEEIPEWYKYSGVHQSSNVDDKLLSDVFKCDFLKDHTTHYTVEQAQTIIRLLFPSKAKQIYEGSSSYGLKHLLEHVSQTINDSNRGRSKYCSNDTIIEAFKRENFKTIERSPNSYMNLLASEVNRAKKIFWNY